MKTIHRNILIGLAVLAVLVLFLLIGGQKGIEVVTDKSSYVDGTSVMVNIRNNSGDKVCFSSCYPYYMEKKAAGWVAYDYGDCRKKDEASKCVQARQIKTFRINLAQADKGLHRLRIPACVGCEIGQDFRADKVFYSNLFEVK